MSRNRDFEPYFYLARRIEENYKVEISCSDYYGVYGRYIISNRHYYTKKETALVESKNSLIRHYLARFNRKTKRYSKAIDMIESSILLLFNKNLLPSIVS